MPLSLSLDLDHDVAIIVLHGELTLAELIEGHQRLEALPGYRPTFNRYADCRTVTRLPSYEEARKIAEMIRERTDPARPVRRAYLVLPGAPYGVVRIIQTFASADAELIQIFTSEQEARAWVGLPPAETQGKSA
jgi:hypothetical protein